MLILILSRTQYAVNKETGVVYATDKINKDGSSYYSERLDAAIGQSDVIEIQKKAIMEDKMYPNLKELSNDVDAFGAGGITEFDYKREVVTDKDGNQTVKSIVRVVVSGNGFKGFKDENGKVDPKSVSKDTNGNDYIDDSAHILMHEMVGHAKAHL